MAQRLMTAASLVAAIAACVMVLFVWRSMDADRQVVMASLDANRDLISQLNDTNARLMNQLELSRQKLEELSTRGSQNIEWVPGEIQFRRGSEDGPPAAGVEVLLTSPYAPGGASASSSELHMPPVKLTTNANGHADLGLVHTGQYQLRLKMPWDEYSVEDVSVHPGKPFSRVIVVPANPLDPVNVTLRVQWPESFEHDDVWVTVWRNPLARQLAGLTWYTRDPLRSYRSSEPKALIVKPDGQVGLSDLTWSEERKLKIGLESIEVVPLGSAEILPINEFPLPNADYRFQSVSFLIRVDGAVADVPRSVDDQPYVAYVPDTYRDNASELFELTDDTSPQLTLTVPPEVMDKIREFRAMMAAEKQAAANQN